MSKPDERMPAQPAPADDDFTFESSEQPISDRAPDTADSAKQKAASGDSSRHGSGSGDGSNRSSKSGSSSSHHSSSSDSSSHHSSSSGSSSHHSSGSGSSSSRHSSKSGSSSHHSSSSGSSSYHSSGSGSSSSRHSSSSDSSSHHSSSSGSSSHHSSKSGSSSHHSSSSGSSSHHSSGSGGSSSRHSSSSDSSSHHSSSERAQEQQEREHRDALIGKYQVVAQDDILSEEVSGKKHRTHHRLRRKQVLRRVLIAIVAIPLVLILAAGSTFLVLNRIGRKQIQAEPVGIQENPYSVSYDEGKTVEYNGKTYELNEHIISFVAIGMDREAFGLQDDKVGTAGQADFIVVAAVDLDTGVVRSILIPRDTITDVDRYSVGGDYVGVDQMQICLAYAYGDGRDTSAQNVLTSAGRVLYGISLQMYGVLDLDGIAVLNDAVGGITVTLQNDYAGASAGQQITLHGMEAQSFVRSRELDALDSDAPRRVRQIQYLRAYIDKVSSAARKDIGVIRRLYAAATEYGFTNVSLAKVTYLATSLLSKGASLGDVITLQGTLQDADPYPEFHADEKAVFETVLDVFYTQVA